ncbi:MAG TPA: dTDP-4-dehydrorhamnose 3,5-epimerase family protein [Actinomycetota bacterium]|nr:dTDP-4-dehydrorhamnose 3,5-epimerase family protein [Actinomycetota bacterium]
MANLKRSDLIDGVLIVDLQGRSDERGRFMETFRQEWFEGRPPLVQGNRSDSRRGVLRGLHFHRHQADYWYAPFGRILVAMHDLRRSSGTRGASQWFEIGEGAELGVYIPPGVAHGFQALTDATLTYLVDRYYDPSDENGLAWDDPDAGIPWPLADPILSPRDMDNPKRQEIPEESLPE